MPHGAGVLNPEPETLDTTIQGAVIFESACQRYLKISTDEFLQKWASGYFRDYPELAHRASDIALLLPLVRAR